MSDNRSIEHKTSNEQLNKIDLTQWIDRFIHSAKRWWWLVILLVAATTLFYYSRVSSHYVPSYTADATLTISSTSDGQALGSDSYSNITKTEQLAEVFSSIVSSGVLDAVIAEHMGLNYVPGSYNVKNVEGTNMLVVTATADDGQVAYDILEAVITYYPEIAQYVVGQTKAVKLDDSGVPEDTGKEYRTRGSIRKGALIGLLLGLMVLFLDMLLQRTIRYQSDFKAMLHHPCLGTLPELQVKKRRKSKQKEISILTGNVPGEYLEAVRSLRSRVERVLEKADKKTFMVTSSVPSEGKSTVAANLAVAFGRKGKKVVLVDCDLRHPSIQSKLSIEGNFPGLSKVLNGEASLQDAMCKLQGLEVYVLPGAAEKSEDIEILGSSEMQKLIYQLETFADFVILDTSPSAILADAITLARNVPTALYVVRCDFAKTRHILDGIEELSETGINVIGCVLNYGKRTGSKSSYGYGYGSGYGYGYGYGYGKKKSERNLFRRRDDENNASEVTPAGDQSQSGSVTDQKISAVAAVAQRVAQINAELEAEQAFEKEAAEVITSAYGDPIPEASFEQNDSASAEKDENTILEQIREKAEEIDILEERIRLLEQYRDASAVAREFKLLNGQEKKAYYQKHYTEIAEYNQILASMKQTFGNQKIPAIRTMRQELERLTFEQNELKKLL